AEPDFVARAPEKKEVEELGKEQIYEALRDKEPLKYTGSGDVEQEELPDEHEEALRSYLDDMIGTRAVYVIDDQLEVVDRFPVDNFNAIEDAEDCLAILVDGEIDNYRINKAESKDAKYIAGMKKADNANSSSLRILTRKELKPGAEA
ncbi:MAG: hypothetical protein ABEJ98_03375, partial [Candidatus Nanohaloarchaea archaeon]